MYLWRIFKQGSVEEKNPEMTKIGVEENIGGEKNEIIADNIVKEKSEKENEEKIDENDEEVQEILAPSGK